MAKPPKVYTYSPDAYNPDLFHLNKDVDRGKATLYYGPRKATADQKRYFNYFRRPGTDDVDITYQRPADAKPVSDHVSLTGKSRNRTPKAPKAPSFGEVPSKVRSKFPSKTNFQQYKNYGNDGGPNRGNPFGNKGWGRPLTLKEGDINYSEPRYYRHAGGKTKLGGIKETFGSKIGSASCVLKNPQAFIRHLEITRHKVKIQAYNFKVAVGKRAIKVFQDSFNKQKFNDAHGTPWAELADFTQKKRQKRGTYPKNKPILREYLDLRNSIEGGFRGSKLYRVTTKPIRANASKHKKVTGVWAGFHNEGFGTYGKGFGGRSPKPYVQRQFMGHSSLLDINTDKFMSFMADRYLFDGLFLV